MTIALVLLAVAAPVARGQPLPEADLLLLPPKTTVSDLAKAGLSPGLMSAGLGKAPAAQTYLDISQGNRVFDSLYDEDLPRGLECWKWQEAAIRRAESAPADIEPFLLNRELRSRGVALFWLGDASCALGGFPGGEGGANSGIFFSGEVTLRQLAKVKRQLRPDDILIAIARPTGESDDPLPIGIAGRGFDGNLTSDSTRIDGYVLSTDVGPTLLQHFGADIPSRMSGQPIRTEGTVDSAAIESLGNRMAVISHRRGPVVGLNVVIWLLGLGLVALLSRGRLARPATRVVGLALVYLPLVLLLGAALEAGETPERLLVLLPAPLLAAATLLLLHGYRALAVASGLTALAYAVDLIAGSPLTSLSLLGPNPGLGVRFYGIGNELEALLAVLVTAGAGAGLAGFAANASRRASALAFLGIGLLAAAVFAAGRFGADVGAAIVFPVGAAVAAVTVADRGRRPLLLAAVAAPVLVLGLLALVDLASGANAHLTRSVLDAGGLGDLADVAQRRLQLSAHSFSRPVLLAFLPLVLAAALIAYLRRERLRAWLRDVPAVRAGLAGALAATMVGTLANDSGALVLEVGAAYLLVFTGFAWAEHGGKSAESKAAD
ncbi:MAG TPA: hypothetical protein VNM38_12025 [Solirubrobacterales bacterium]|nr:hypothetical protein [Solirubrobacterales bacterium]